MRDKPGRPFGLTLAILVSIVLYTVLPLLVVGGILVVEEHFRNIQETTLVLPGMVVQEPVVGGNFRGGITDAQLILQSIIAVAFLVIALLSWRGKPPVMRHVFTGTVVLLSGSIIALTLFPPSSDTQGVSGGSLTAALEAVSCVQVGAYIVLPLYVIWYLNRAPSRAFFRGYYLE